jgi:arylsulfatase A-like enzyme
MQDRNTTDIVFGTVRDIIGFRNNKITLDSEKIYRLEKLYNGEIAYLDSEIGKLLDGISQRDLDNDTVIVITADHGEEFLEHDGFEHGHTLYDELLHVPLIVRPPLTESKNKPVKVPTTVRHIDIAPTLCELVGIKSDPDFVGQSFAALLQGKKENDRPVFSQGNMWGPSGTALRKDGLKLIKRSSSDIQLFDICNDPDEQENLSKKELQKYIAMTTELDLAVQKGSTDSLSTAPSLSHEDMEKLRSLGYTK